MFFIPYEFIFTRFSHLRLPFFGSHTQPLPSVLGCQAGVA